MQIPYRNGLRKMEEPNTNRIKLDQLTENFKQWLHIEDPNLLYTMAAMKVSHRIPGDPIWIQFIGPSSGGKSEM